MIGLAFVDGWVEFDEYIAGIDVLAVSDPYGAHDAGLKGLNHLAVAAWDNLTGRGRHDIDMAEARPGQGQHKHRNKGHADRPADGGRGRFDDFQRGRQEGEVLPVPQLDACRKGNNLLVRIDEILRRTQKRSLTSSVLPID